MVNAATATQTAPGTTHLLDVTGSNFVSGAQIQAAGAPVTTTVLSSGEAQATITLAAGTTSVAVVVVNPDPGSAMSGSATAQVKAITASLPASARLLDQATFGPTLTDIQHVESVGLQGYLNEQFAMTPTLLAAIPVAPTVICSATNLAPCEQSEWWQEAMTAPTSCGSGWRLRWPRCSWCRPTR